MPGFKEGSRCKAGEVVAYDPSFFSPTRRKGEVAYKAGLLVRTAIAPLDQTYEDSLVITRRLAEDTAAQVTIMRPVSLGPNANLTKVARVGDKVDPSTALAVFENIADDEAVAKALSRIGAEFDEAIGELAKNTAVAKERGEVVEIRTYYNVPRDKLSDSIKVFVDRQEKLAEARRKIVSKGPRDEPLRVTFPEYVERSKIHGIPVEGVLIMFFIKTEDVAGPGDKFTGGGALKGIVARVLEPGEEPTCDDGGTIDYVVSPLSLASRMTPDAFLTLWTNAVLVGLRDRVVEIAKGE